MLVKIDLYAEMRDENYPAVNRRAVLRRLPETGLRVLNALVEKPWDFVRATRQRRFSGALASDSITQANPGVNAQMAYLFLSSFSILSVSYGLFPLLPLYASRFGATPTLVGIYLALTYLSITAGTILAGWLAGRVSRKLMLSVGGGLGVVAVLSLGQATGFWQVVVLTGLVWFSAGIGLAVINVLTGLYTNRATRGKWFSLIALANPLGAIVGGLLVGQLVEWQGYPLMFVVMAVVYALWPLLGMLKMDDLPVAEKRQPGKARRSLASRPGVAFYLLLAAELLSAMTVSIDRLGMSLVMEGRGFSAGSIATASAIGGLVTIPVVVWFGRLSDRMGRRVFLGLGYLLAAVGGIGLLTASQLWHFWVVAATALLARSICHSLAAALATDLLAPAVLGKYLPRISSVTWIAGVIGFAGSGVLIEVVGSHSLFVLATTMSLGAAGVAGWLPGRRRSARRALDARNAGRCIPAAASC